MRMNPGIILGIEPVNVMNALSQGAQTANAINTVRENNALAPFRMEQAQLGVEQGKANLELTRERLVQIRQQAAREAQAAVQSGKAQELAAEAAEMERIVSLALAQPEMADQIFGSSELTQEYVGMDPRAVGVSLLGVKDALEQTAPTDPKDRYRVVGDNLVDLEAEGQPRPVEGLPQDAPTPQSAIAKLRADLDAGLITKDDFEREIQRMAPRGMRLDVGPDGSISFVEGAADSVPQKPLTEAQSKDNVYATRARGALPKLEQSGNALTSRRDRVLEGVPLGVGREAQSQDFQVAKQAGDEFLQAILRKDTGAAITEQEQDLYGETYLPQPGDGPAVLAAKRESRARAVAAIEAGMSEAQLEQITQTEKQLIESIKKTNDEIGPQPGAVEDGYRFNGGDPADPASWEKVE